MLVASPAGAGALVRWCAATVSACRRKAARRMRLGRSSLAPPRSACCAFPAPSRSRYVIGGPADITYRFVGEKHFSRASTAS
jgi:hypothetical protein